VIRQPQRQGHDRHRAEVRDPRLNRLSGISVRSSSAMRS